MTNIVLYDLAQRTEPSRCWSFNVWKTRMALNYKKIPFTTVWVDSNTLAPTLKSISAPTNPSSQVFEYTIPTIKLPDCSVVTDSSVIALKLEALHPSPCLHLDPELQAEAEAVVLKMLMTLLAIYVPRVVRNIVNESAVTAFAAPREKLLGVTFEELEKKGGPQAWEAAEDGFDAMKQLLTVQKVDKGPFIKGSQVCYADFILVAAFESLHRGGEDMFEIAVGRDQAFRDLYNASSAWLQNDQ
ncbi:hypothetical protein EDB81DRAFT_920506 [Dactylonectria macrodidyma]|uniref:GST N-terminal domain-containing protein n=1 Tax=Dactylonectria macrodidyma TaxID=307937 RepID=A0A9P9D8E5_9HYPO|nr:hypothetical protein EDB81DRAFT_920506 [Dactylonectria macrodidyma]